MLSKNVDLNNTVILVTGAAGFVGANLVMSLLSEAEGTQIIGIDSVNDYYDVALKDYRLQQIDEMSKDNKKGILQIKPLLKKFSLRINHVLLLI